MIVSVITSPDKFTSEISVVIALFKSGLPVLHLRKSKFSTKKLEDYGSIKINFNKIDTSKNPVLQIIKDNKLIESIKISEKILTRKLLNPGEYELRILLDKNNNGVI